MKGQKPCPGVLEVGESLPLDLRVSKVWERYLENLLKRSEKLGFKIHLTYEYFHSLWQNHMKEDCPEEELRDKVVSGFKS